MEVAEKDLKFFFFRMGACLWMQRVKVAEIFSSGWALVDAEGGGCGKRPKVFFSSG